MNTTRRFLLLALAALTLAACASTTLRNAWYDPSFAQAGSRVVTMTWPPMRGSSWRIAVPSTPSKITR